MAIYDAICHVICQAFSCAPEHAAPSVALKKYSPHMGLRSFETLPKRAVAEGSAKLNKWRSRIREEWPHSELQPPKR